MAFLFWKSYILSWIYPWLNSNPVSGVSTLTKLSICLLFSQKQYSIYTNTSNNFYTWNSEQFNRMEKYLNVTFVCNRNRRIRKNCLQLHLGDLLVQLPHLLPVFCAKGKQVLEKTKQLSWPYSHYVRIHSRFSGVNSNLLLIHLHQVSQEVPVGHGLPVG